MQRNAFRAVLTTGRDMPAARPEHHEERRERQLVDLEQAIGEMSAKAGHGQTPNACL